jgi:hypothetical protein
VRPPCLTRKGCDYLDVAPDEALNRKVDAFLQAEMLEYSGPGYHALADKLVRESGLLDESAATVLEAKSELAEFRAWRDRQSQAKARARR